MVKKLQAYETEKAALDAEIEEARATRDPRYLREDGSYIYLTLEDIKEHLYLWFSDYEVKIVTLIVMAEDWIAQSKTIWAAHVWCILDRVGCPGFVNNQDIYAVLSDTSQFPTWTPENLSKEPRAEVEWVVRDVMARFVLEQMGASPETVGRTLPADVHFFNTDGVSKYNRFYYDWHWTNEYDPFSSPFNPYET